MKKKAIIFDLDGVLVDSEAYYQERKRAFLKANDISLKKPLATKEMIGHSLREVLKKATKNFSVSEVERLAADYQQFKQQQVIPYRQLIYPEAREVLFQLKAQKILLGLASSSSLESINEMLTQCELQSVFAAITSGVEVKETKPAPDIYLRTIEKLSISANHCLAIEDSAVGILSAKSAGLEVWALKDQQFGMDQSFADKVILSLTELL